MIQETPNKKLFDSVAYIIFLLLLGAAATYCFTVGANFVWPDSLFYSVNGAGLAPAGKYDAPLCKLMMLIPRAHEAGHEILVALQALLITSCFFPLYGLLKRGTDLNNVQASLLAAATVLAPVSLTYGFLFVPEALFIALLCWFTFVFDTLLRVPKMTLALLCAVLLAAMILTLKSGWAVWLAVSMVYAFLYFNKPKSCSLEEPCCVSTTPLFLVIFMPLIILLQWAAVSNSNLLSEFFTNNPLARFNLIKNGLLYILYAGVPLTGMGFALAMISKGRAVWAQPFMAFAALALLFALLLEGFSTQVIVDGKLNIISNRLLEPFLFLPLIGFFRLSPETRKEVLANGLMLFFVLALLGYPFDLKPDFKSGLSYWANSLQISSYGIIRNAMYMVLVAIPVAFALLKPKYFFKSFMVVAFVAAALGAFANYLWWHKNTDSSLANMDAVRFAKLEPLPTFTDYHCAPDANNDLSYLYRCFDVTKALYFLRGGVVKGEAKGQSYALSTENDVPKGDVVAASGLAQLVKTDGKNTQKLPEIFIQKIKGASRYEMINFGDALKRVALLDRETVLTIDAKEKTCADFSAIFAMDNAEESLRYQLNEGDEKSVKIQHFDYKGAPAATRFRLNLPQGVSTLKLSYGKSSGSPFVQTPANLILINRPQFAPCD